MASIVIPSREKFIDSLRFRGKKKAVTAGSHIDDLVALRKTITLCPRCFPKFKHREYIRVRSKGKPIRATGECDGCKAYGPGNAMFVHETHQGVVANLSI